MLQYYFLAIVLVLITYYLWKPRNLPPGPWGLPIVGYLPWLNPKAPYLTLSDLAKKYGSMYGIYLGSVYTVVLTDPKTIKTLFAKDATTGRAPLYLTHGIMKGYGLICAEGDLWKDQRRFVLNCIRNLGGSKIGSQRKTMADLILKHAMDFVNYIKTRDKYKAIDPLKPLRHNLGSLINDIVFGKSWPRDDETWMWLQETQEEGTKHIGIAGPLNFLPFLRFVPIFKRTMSFLIEGKRKTHRFYQKLIDEENLLLNKSRSANLGTDRYTNLIQGFLIEREKRRNTDDVDKYYSDQQFYHLLADVFGAGLDTTLTTIRWFLLYLAKYEDIQIELRKEIKSILQNRPPSLEDVSSMPLMEACIAETQRIRSVVPVGIPHGAAQDIEINGFNIPKGSMIVPLQWAIHMNEEEYRSPESFNYSRFISDEGKFCKGEYFIPFQNGKRMCVGDELGKMIMFLFCTTILQNLIIKLEDKENADLEGECGITLTPKSYKLYFLQDA